MQMGNLFMVPTYTGKQGKPEKVGEPFTFRRKLGNFEQTGKVREFYPQYWKNRNFLHWKIQKKR